MRLCPAGTRLAVKGGFRNRLSPRLGRKERIPRKNMVKAQDAIDAQYVVEEPETVDEIDEPVVG